MTASMTAAEAEYSTLPRVGVLTEDAVLARRMSLALEGAATVVMLPAGAESDGGAVECALLFSDERGGGGAAAGDEKDATVPIVERAVYAEGMRALPYPFAFGELRSLITNDRRGARLVAESDGRHVRLDGERIRLTESEHKLLAAIASGGGEFVSREVLVREAFGEGAEGGILNVYVHYLREKLEHRGEKIILSSRRGGYRINEKYLGVVK